MYIPIKSNLLSKPESGSLYLDTETNQLYVYTDGDFQPVVAQSGGSSACILSDFVNVQTDYGAVGDGSTDDTQAFRDAVQSGKNVYVPAGTYKITNYISLPAGIIVLGSTPAKSILRAYDYQGEEKEDIFYIENDNCIIANLTMDAQNYENAISMEFGSLKLINCVIKNCGIGVDLSYASILEVYHSTFSNCEYAIYSHSCTVIISDSQFYFNSSVVDGIYLFNSTLKLSNSSLILVLDV